MKVTLVELIGVVAAAAIVISLFVPPALRDMAEVDRLEAVGAELEMKLWLLDFPDGDGIGTWGDLAASLERIRMAELLNR